MIIGDNQGVSRRTFIRGLGAGAAALALTHPLLAAAESLGGKRPDILFFAIDDVSPRRFGCWGNTICKTPHIDRLATQGLRFDQAHCMSALCGPSRTSLLTCLRPDTTKVYNNKDNWQKLAPQAQSMLEHLRKNEYETVRIGKIGGGSIDQHDASWSRVIKVWSKEFQLRQNKMRPGKGPGMKFKSAFVWGPTGLEDWEEWDGRVADQAIRILSKGSDRPLFLGLGMETTHLPFRAPDKYFDMYPTEKIVLPPEDKRFMQRKKTNRDQKHLTDETWREAIAAHYACLSFIDTQVGRILEALDKSGRADNTIVVLWSDHGYMLGEHFLWRKWHMYDECTQVPLIMRVPGVTTSGSVCKRPVESIDIFPTLFDLCGVPIPADIEAISMKPLLKDPQLPWKKGAITVQSDMRSIRTERWRYTEQGKARRPSLYDHDNDPHEFVDLAKNKKYAETVSELSRLLNGDWKLCLPDQ